MPLGDDQKAMLRLLASGQSYDDIAALMGLSVDEVATRAKGAVAQLESEGIPAPALPEAPGGSAPQSPPAAAKAPEPAPPAAPPPPPSSPPKAPRTPKPRDKNMLIAIGGGIVGLIVIVVLAVLLISNSDGDGDTTSAGSGTGTTVAEDGGSANREPTTAQLEAVDGSAASGTAEFGRVEDSLALGIDATEIERLPKGQIYMVWLADTTEKLLPLTAVVANKANRIKASYQVPTEAVVYLASGEFDQLVITRTQSAELRKSLEQANTDKDFPAYTGDPVLEGQIIGPIVGAAERLEEQRQK